MTNAAGAGIFGVSFEFSGVSGTVTTDMDGRFTQVVPSGWSGTATPSNAAYDFEPAVRMFADVTANLAGQDFLARSLVGNDRFADRIVIAGTNVLLTASTIGATKEPGEPKYFGNPGGASVWWTWCAPFSGALIITTAGSGFDTSLGAYTGSSVSRLVEVASNEDEAYERGIFTSRVAFDVQAGQTYQISIDGWQADSGLVKLHLYYGERDPAPLWILPDPYNVTINSTNYTGKVVLLDFWATYCGPCRTEIPDLIALQDKYRSDGLVIVGASVDYEPSTVRDFLTAESPPINYPVVMASYALVRAYGGVPYIPTTFIIDRQNIIREFTGTLEDSILPFLYGNTVLRAQNGGNSLGLTWPVQVQTFALESANDLATPNWTAWPTPPVVADGTNTVSVPMPAASKYFRLRLNY